MTSDCIDIDTSCIGSECVYGQVECDIDVWTGLNIMVATGYNTDKIDDTEVINTDTITSCSNLPAKYPMEVAYAVAMKHDSKMVICGNYPEYTSDCYSYSSNQWNLEAFKLEPARRGAMSTEIRPGEWLIMGGDDDSLDDLTDTKLLKNGIFTQGPSLFEPIYGGSSVMLNETHLFVASAHSYSSFSPRNYLLDIDAERWRQIAERTLTPSTFHSSGTFLNRTAGEIQVANIGQYGIEVYSPRDDFWHEVPFPSPITYLEDSTAIQQGTDSFILIGGATNLETYSDDIFLFDENGFSILKENVLRIPRYDHVAMPISKDDFTCA